MEQRELSHEYRIGDIRNQDWEHGDSENTKGITQHIPTAGLQASNYPHWLFSSDCRFNYLMQLPEPGRTTVGCVSSEHVTPTTLRTHRDRPRSGCLRHSFTNSVIPPPPVPAETRFVSEFTDTPADTPYSAVSESCSWNV